MSLKLHLLRTLESSLTIVKCLQCRPQVFSLQCVQLRKRFLKKLTFEQKTLCSKGATTLNITTFSITTFSITTLSIMTLNIMGLVKTFSTHDTQHNSIECHYADCRNYLNVILSVVMLSVIASFKELFCIRFCFVTLKQQTRMFFN